MKPVVLHHILLKSSWLAQDIEDELKLGADFDDLAKEYSACLSGQNGGFAGYHQLDDLPEELVTALNEWDGSSLYTPITQSRYGFHILKPVAPLERLLISDTPS